MKWRNKKYLKRGTLLISIGLLILALTQKCYCTTSLCGDAIAVFIFGALGIFYGGAALCWLANPLLIFSWIFIRKRKFSLVLSLLSTLIVLSFLLFDEVIDNEAGHYSKIISYEIGYWLWLSSNFSMFLGNVLLINNKHSAAI